MKNLTAGAALALVLSLLHLHAAHAASAPAPEELTSLITTIKQRIEIGEEVALSKWYSGKPVHDGDRERQVIANATSRAGEYRLGKDDVHRFMSAQIEANKMLQYARLAQWHAVGIAPQKAAANLAQDIRARLDNLQPELLTAYAAFARYSRDVQCPAWTKSVTEQQATDPVVATAMLRAASDLCTSSPTGTRS